MKYWKNGAGDCGTVDIDGYVPGSVEISKAEYDQYVADQPVVQEVAAVVEFECVDTGKRYRMRRIIEG